MTRCIPPSSHPQGCCYDAVEFSGRLNSVRRSYSPRALRIPVRALPRSLVLAVDPPPRLWTLPDPPHQSPIARRRTRKNLGSTGCVL